MLQLSTPSNSNKIIFLLYTTLTAIQHTTLLNSCFNPTYQLYINEYSVALLSMFHIQKESLKIQGNQII